MTLVVTMTWVIALCIKYLSFTYSCRNAPKGQFHNIFQGVMWNAGCHISYPWYFNGSPLVPYILGVSSLIPDGIVFHFHPTPSRPPPTFQSS